MNGGRRRDDESANKLQVARAALLRGRTERSEEALKFAAFAGSLAVRRPCPSTSIRTLPSQYHGSTHTGHLLLLTQARVCCTRHIFRL